MSYSHFLLIISSLMQRNKKSVIFFIFTYCLEVFDYADLPLPSTVTSDEFMRDYIDNQIQLGSNVVSGISLFILPNPQLFLTDKLEMLLQVQRILVPQVFFHPETDQYVWN